MNKQKIFLISAFAILGAGLFSFFYVPNSLCVILRDPSGKPSEVCDLGGRQSPYQKIFLKMHRYFYPNDTCMISIETGEVNCEHSISLLSPTCDQSATTTNCGKIWDQQQAPLIATSTPVSEWETFENTEYGYSVSVPQATFIDGIAMSSPDPHIESELYFKSEEGFFDITVKTLSLKMELDIGKELFEKQKKLLALDLKLYAQAVRDHEANDPNPYILNRKVGELKEIQFAGTKAYEFILERSFANLTEAPRIFIVAENFQGQKIIIRHTINNTSEKMVQTIKFTK